MGVGWRVVTLRQLSPLIPRTLGGIHSSHCWGFISPGTRDLLLGRGDWAKKQGTSDFTTSMSSDRMGNRPTGSSLSRCHFFLPISSLLLFKSQYASFSCLLLLVRRHLSCLKHLLPQKTLGDCSQ